MVTFCPRKNASLRTKNRLKEHGPFKIEKFSDNVACFKGRAVLLRASDGWFGWLPDDEIIMTGSARDDDFTPRFETSDSRVSWPSHD